MAGVTILQNAVNSGDTQYDVFCNNSYRTAEAAYNGLLSDLTALDSLDLTKEYWSQGLNETASVGHRQYLCTGPMSLGFFRYIMVTVFNKKMFTQNDIEFPYKTVLNGKWTLEAMNDIAKDLYRDLNGNNERDKDDQYGYVTRMGADTSINDGFWSSLDLHTTAKDADDFYTYSIDTDSFSTAVDNLFTLMKGNGTANKCDNDGDIYQRFYNGLAAMSNARLYMVESDEFRNMEDEYGILPMPKRDENQKEYYSLAQDQFLVYAVPVHLDDRQKQDAGTFLEAYASESYLTVKPAYYETALTTKYVNDAESAAMLDIITSGLYTDPSVLYLTVFTFNVMNLRNMLGSGNNTMSSTIEAVRKSMETKLQKLNETFAGLEG